MRLTRRGLFGLLGGAVAAAVCPKSSPETGAWRSGYWCRTESNWPKRLYFSEQFAHHEFGLSFEITEDAEGHDALALPPRKRTRHERWKERKSLAAVQTSGSSDVARKLRAAAERLRRA